MSERLGAAVVAVGVSESQRAAATGVADARPCRVAPRLAAAAGSRDVVLAPIGFACEHMETVYDLDVEASGLCEELGLNMVRAAAVGAHRRFVQMIRELILERTGRDVERLALGTHGPAADTCSPA